MTDTKTPGIVNIRGKQYETVAFRVHKFREKLQLHSLTTDILHIDDFVVRVKATISDESGRIVATGHAEEYRKSSEINKTSALENAETSAIGRALACFGLGGTEFASANEVERAIGGHKGEPPINTDQPELQKIALLTENDIANIIALADEVNVSINPILHTFKVTKLEQIARLNLAKIIRSLEKKRALA
jgi:hypothetical protein